MALTGAVRGLNSSDSEDALVTNLQLIAQKGGAECAAAVARHLGHQAPDVAAAAADALGAMAPAGARYADELANGLKSDSAKVKQACASALGAFGEDASGYGEQLATVVNGATPDEELAKLAAIQALGRINAKAFTDVVAKNLDDKSPDVQGAVCMALGYLGAADKASDVAKKLNQPETCLAAICALDNMGADACAPNASAIIDKCITAADLPTRASALGALLKIKPTGESTLAGLCNAREVATRASAALALGNWGGAVAGDAKTVAAVAELLKDDTEDVNWIPLQVGGGSTRAPMALRKPKCAALVALGGMKASDFARDVADLLNDGDWEVRFCALEAMAGFGDAAKSHADAVASLLDDDTYAVRAKACFALGAMKAEAQAEKVSGMLGDKAQCVRAEAVAALGSLGDQGAPYSGEMGKLLGDDSNNVRAAAAGAFANLGEPGRPYASAVAGLLNDSMPDVRAAACLALARMGPQGAAFAEDVAAAAGDDEDAGVREAAAEAAELMSS